MAGTMVHLTVAEILWQVMQERNMAYVSFDSRPQEDFFVVGNICPDGIMARENYQREMKLHTHFRDGIPDGSFDAPGKVQLFEERMQQFWGQHLAEEQQTPGLYLGYVTHMMTDEYFILEERPKFFRNIARIGLTQRDRETFVRFNRETDLVDFKLLRQYPVLQNARQSLERVPEYEIRGMITASELTKSRKWIIQHFFEEEHDNEEAEFLAYDSMVSFIRDVAARITDRLLTEGYLQARKS
ncbi:MAG: hypothetical protein LUH14_00435 [Clostridiaceae bacterium]|nr:hypothetical protein [Clostridiaceae bacterium]